MWHVKHKCVTITLGVRLCTLPKVTFPAVFPEYGQEHVDTLVPLLRYVHCQYVAINDHCLGTISQWWSHLVGWLLSTCELYGLALLQSQARV